MPKTGGSGTTNDGNTARRALKDPKLLSDISGIDYELINRLGIILILINSNYKISSDLFRIYCKNTAECYAKLYPWFNMPASLHKVLIHGHSIIDCLSLPIGYYSEEAGESRNKDTKNYRLYHSRKNSRKHTNEDQIHLLCATSDPFISTIRQRVYKDKRMRKKLPKEAFNLIEDEIDSGDNISSSESESEIEVNISDLNYNNEETLKEMDIDFADQINDSDFNSEIPEHFNFF